MNNKINCPEALKNDCERKLALSAVIFSGALVLTGCGTTPSTVAMPTVISDSWTERVPVTSPSVIALVGTRIEVTSTLEDVTKGIHRATITKVSPPSDLLTVGSKAKLSNVRQDPATGLYKVTIQSEISDLNGTELTLRLHAPKEKTGIFDAVVIGVGPTTPAASTPDPDENRYRLGSAPNASTLATRPTSILLEERTIGGVRAQLKAHDELWRAESTRLRSGIDGLNNTQFGGAILSAFGIIGKSTDVGAAGVAIAGGAGVWGDHYKMQVQADNYSIASKAVQCMHRAISAIPLDYWTLTYHSEGPRTGQMRIARADYGGVEIEAYSKMAGLWRTIYTRLDEVRERLIKSQRTLSIATPAPNELLKALGQEGKASQGASNAFDALAKIMDKWRTETNVPHPVLPDIQTLEQVFKLPEELETCSKTIGT